MSYYPTIAEDLRRAREILARGKPAHDEVAYLPTELLRSAALSGGTIYGADVYAAYKLLESFIAEIESLHLLLDTIITDVETWIAEIDRGGTATIDVRVKAGGVRLTCPVCGYTLHLTAEGAAAMIDRTPLRHRKCDAAFIATVIE